MYCHNICWCIRKCPLYRGVLIPLSEVPQFEGVSSQSYCGMEGEKRGAGIPEHNGPEQSLQWS